MRQALGMAVFTGMIGVTIFGLLFTPVFYVIASWATQKKPGGCAPGIVSRLGPQHEARLFQSRSKDPGHSRWRPAFLRSACATGPDYRPAATPANAPFTPTSVATDAAMPHAW